MKKILVIVLLLLLVVLQYQLWFAAGGLGKTLKLQHLVHDQRKINSELKTQNDNLLDDVNDLKKGEAVIENTARHDLGMVKNGEVFYRIIKDKKKI